VREMLVADLPGGAAASASDSAAASASASVVDGRRRASRSAASGVVTTASEAAATLSLESPVFANESRADVAQYLALVAEADRVAHTFLSGSSSFTPTSLRAPRPYLLFQTWTSREAVPADVYLQAKALAPGYQHIVVADADVEKLLQESPAHPFGSALLRQYHALHRFMRAYAADLLRYVLMYIHGGVYADIDTILAKPLDVLFPDRAGAYSAIEWHIPGSHRAFGVAQNVLAAPPRMPFFRRLIDSILSFKFTADGQLSNDNHMGTTLTADFFALLKTEAPETTREAMLHSKKAPCCMAAGGAAASSAKPPDVSQAAGATATVTNGTGEGDPSAPRWTLFYELCENKDWGPKQRMHAPPNAANCLGQWAAHNGYCCWQQATPIKSGRAEDILIVQRNPAYRGWYHTTSGERVRHHTRAFARFWPDQDLHHFNAERVDVSLPAVGPAGWTEREKALFLWQSKREPRLRRILASLYRGGVLDPSLSVIDGGANVGDFSLPLAALLRETAASAGVQPGTVYAVDPSPRNVKMIHALARASGLPNLLTVEAALGAHAGVAAFNMGGDADSMQSGSVAQGNDRQAASSSPATALTLHNVTIATLDAIETRSAVGFVHLDLEHFENVALEGADRLARVLRPVFVTEVHGALHAASRAKAERGCPLSRWGYLAATIPEVCGATPSCRNWIWWPDTSTRDRAMALIGDEMHGHTVDGHHVPGGL